MFKNILILGLLCTVLTAQESEIDFDTFLQKALSQSPYLASSTLAISQAKELGSSLTRYKNPSLELEYSSFNPAYGDTESGYRVNYSQDIRLWGVGDDKTELSQNMSKSATALHTSKKALFIRNIALSFTTYAEKKMLLKLGDEELSISQKIYDISQARYSAGTISKALLLQSSIDHELISIQNSSLALATNQAYYQLLQFGGITQELKLNTSHTFILKPQNRLNNPNIKLLQADKQRALSKAKVNSNSVEWVQLIAEYENEPDQNIARVGLSFPLAIFNTKTQEKNIATLEASRSQLLIENENKSLIIEFNRLQKERLSLEELLYKNRDLLKSELKLLDMFQNGYKISNINLLQLQDIKNKMITTKRTIIHLKTALNKNAITTNYNQGQYND